MKEELAEQISKWLKQKVIEAGAKGVVLGLSGGLDSAVTAVLCKRAFPNQTLVFILPCYSNPKDVEDANLIAKEFKIEAKTFDLSSLLERMYKKMEEQPYKEKPSIPIGNLKARLRMLVLYYFANKLNYLVAGTGTKSELKVGYFTKFGDGAADLLPLGDLLKIEVRELAKNLGIPERIINKTPSAGLWEGQTDEGEIGMGYRELDPILSALESNDLSGFDKEKVKKVKQMIKHSKHKRERIPIFRKWRSE
jgi:NAD+ synthase